MDIYDKPLMTESRIKDNLCVFLAADNGYIPFLNIMNRMCDEYGFVLTNSYGITDMQATFEFHHRVLYLKYYSMLDMVTLETDAIENELIREFRKIAIKLGAHKAP